MYWCWCSREKKRQAFWNELSFLPPGALQRNTPILFSIMVWDLIFFQNKIILVAPPPIIVKMNLLRSTVSFTNKCSLVRALSLSEPNGDYCSLRNWWVLYSLRRCRSKPSLKNTFYFPSLLLCRWRHKTYLHAPLARSQKTNSVQEPKS